MNFLLFSLDEENTRDSRIGGPSRSNWLNYNRDASMKELLSSNLNNKENSH